MSNQSQFKTAVETVEKLTSALRLVIRGREDTIRHVLTGLIANGHVLLEDYPGSGKTTLAKTLGRLIDCSRSTSAAQGIVAFRRIQFTPDLLPSDVLGVTVFDTKSGAFRFQHGPIFSHVVLADEINRTGPKVQAAFLECMAEKQVTIDNATYPLDELFFVIGTQNPLDLAGTYPLPLVQLDRFLLKIPMSYVNRETELQILNDAEQIANATKNVSAVVSREEVLAARDVVNRVNIAAPLIEAVVDIVQTTRKNPALQFGASTRAALMLRQALCSWALIQGRDYVTEDDLKTLLVPVLLHRLKFHPAAGEPAKALLELATPALERLASKI